MSASVTVPTCEDVAEDVGGHEGEEAGPQEGGGAQAARPAERARVDLAGDAAAAEVGRVPERGLSLYWERRTPCRLGRRHVGGGGRLWDAQLQPDARSVATATEARRQGGASVVHADRHVVDG